MLMKHCAKSCQICLWLLHCKTSPQNYFRASSEIVAGIDVKRTPRNAVLKCAFRLGVLSKAKDLQPPVKSLLGHFLSLQKSQLRHSPRTKGHSWCCWKAHAAKCTRQTFESFTATFISSSPTKPHKSLSNPCSATT